MLYKEEVFGFFMGVVASLIVWVMISVIVKNIVLVEWDNERSVVMSSALYINSAGTEGEFLIVKDESTRELMTFDQKLKYYDQYLKANQ